MVEKIKALFKSKYNQRNMAHSVGINLRAANKAGK